MININNFLPKVWLISGFINQWGLFITIAVILFLVLLFFKLNSLKRIKLWGLEAEFFDNSEKKPKKIVRKKNKQVKDKRTPTG